MIADQMINECIPIRFHDNSFSDIDSNLVFVSINLFKAQSRWGLTRNEGRQ